MDDRPIGVFDSGIGGLTILREIIRELPLESFIYVGDSFQTPYSCQTPKEIYQFSKCIVNYLLKKDVKLIVIACNTITVSCIKKLREDYPHIPIVGTVPVVKKAAEVTKNKRIGILSSTRTAKSEEQKQLIKKFADGCQVFNYGTDELVPLIEQGIVTGKEIDETLRKVLAIFKENDIDTLALGCTHFPFLRKQIQTILGPHMQVLDSGSAIARQVRKILQNNNALSTIKKPSLEFYTTGKKLHMENIVRKIVKAEEITIVQSIAV